MSIPNKQREIKTPKEIALQRIILDLEELYYSTYSWKDNDKIEEAIKILKSAKQFKGEF